MSDADIIRAFECCGLKDNERKCYMCPLAYTDMGCSIRLPKDVLDLINRQQAEILELKHKIENCNEQIDELENEIHTMVEFQMEV